MKKIFINTNFAKTDGNGLLPVNAPFEIEFEKPIDLSAICCFYNDVCFAEAFSNEDGIEAFDDDKDVYFIRPKVKASILRGILANNKTFKGRMALVFNNGKIILREFDFSVYNI